MKLTFSEKLLYIMATVADHNRRAFNWQLVSTMSGDPCLYKHRRWLLNRLKDKRKRKRLYTAFQSFKRSKYLQEKVFGNTKGYILTPKGRLKIFRSQIKRLEKKRLTKNNYLMVFFDIPEKKRGLRNILRSVLKELGFEKVQRSVWVSVYDVSRELKKLINEQSLEKYVKLLFVKELEN